MAVPTTLNFDAAAEANKTWHGDAASAPARPTRFFFSGSYGRDEGTGYSLGARLAVRSAVVLANRTDYVFIGPNGGYGPHNMQRDAMLSAMRSSVFCLAPSGNGYGNRITYAMVAGCIPVVVQPSVRQPLDDVLPYWRFSLRLRLEDAPNLVQILDAVTPGEVEALQSHVKLYHSYFLWRGWSDLPGASGWTGEGLAYEGVLESLRRKLYHIQADMEGEGAAPLPAGG